MSYQQDQRFPEAYPPPGYNPQYQYPPPGGYQGPSAPPPFPYPPPPGYEAPTEQGHCCHHGPPPPPLPGYQQSYQAYFNQGYPPQQYPPHYSHDDHSDGGCFGFLRGCLAALCCCCLFEECCL